MEALKKTRKPFGGTCQRYAISILGKYSVSLPLSSSSPLVSIVTATYNRCGDVMALLAQLAQLEYPVNHINVIVVDNASTDGTVQKIREKHPAVQVIENSSNIGIAAGFNVGLTHVLESQPKAKYIWLLDSDVGLENASLAPLVEAMEQDDQLGIAGSVVYDPQNRDRLVTAGLRVVWESGQISFVTPGPDYQEDLVEVDLIAACSLLVRSEPCVQLGVWDSQLRLYWGDTDWCARFKRAGYRVVCHLSSRAWHRDWTAVDRGFFTPIYIHDHVRGALLFLVRHNPQGSLTSARRLILNSYLRAAMEQLTMRLGLDRAYEFAVGDFLKGSFESRDFEEIVGRSLSTSFDEVAEEIGGHFNASHKLSVTAFCDQELQTKFKDTLQDHFAEVQWSDKNDDSGEDRMLNRQSGLRVWMPQLFQFLGHLLMFPLRKDLLVTELSRPQLSHLAMARYTVFLDSQGRALLCKNRIFAGLWRLTVTLVRGLRIAYFDLPRAVNNSSQLQHAIHLVDSNATYQPAEKNFSVAAD